MYIDFAGDWPAYVSMAVFVLFMVYVIIKGHAKEETPVAKTEEKK
ncbi:hypothetical protein [Endomicrobium proavitum]|uniref:Uncharacterized protein n=1 Tax=Endomicrobium proavitum TaxID=1408281 RepID=A0A0G3WIG9_9BACT|nr:hypothetical protein [Endomicrobium proavitum]AKL98098.1 hypothetical protein Epro_0719 [Endomicrobium proavitum]